MTIEIRLATPEDIDTITDHVIEFYHDPREFCRKRIEYSIANNFIVVAIDKGKGIVVGKLIFQAKENPHLGAGEFEAVEVHPNYQGRGIGSQIIERSIEEARLFFKRYGKDLSWLYLFAQEDNVRAISLYRKFGFVKGPVVGRVFTGHEIPQIYMHRDFTK